MPKRHALELVPDEVGQEAVVRDWTALRDAGLPSQLDHRGATNSPHVTVVSATDLSDAPENLARVLLEPLFPVRVRSSGLLLLGEETLTVARALDVEDELIRAVLDVRAITPGKLKQGWLPHVTLARHVARSDLQRVLDVLGRDEVVFELVELRRWDPRAGTVRTIASL